MGRYRTYKNGIYGHRYRGYYIVKGERGNFSILEEDGSVFRNKIIDYEECEWIIDKYTASEDELNMMKLLYDKEIYQLSSLFIELMQKKEREGLDNRSEILYKLVEKVRKRKADERIF